MAARMSTAFSVILLLCGLQLTQAVKVYLNPPQTHLRSALSPKDASFALSRHLGLEHFEFREGPSVNAGYGEESFVGQGLSNALLLTMDEEDASAILPSSLQHSFTLSTPPSTPIVSLSSVVSTYLHRAKHSYSSVFGGSMNFSPSRNEFLAEIDSLSSFFDNTDDFAFAAMELSGLANLRLQYGKTSEAYTVAVDATRAFLEGAIYRSDKMHIALLTFTPGISHSLKRQSESQPSQAPLPPHHPSPQEPIGSISTCFSTVVACTNGTNSCSGRGACVKASKAGRTCFVCTCGVTKTGEGNKVKTDTWVGESCERKDISGPFVLLTGTAIVLIILVVGSISLLYGVGYQEMPSTLMGGAVGARKE